MLWVIPLGLYLLSFVFAFNARSALGHTLARVAPVILLLAGLLLALLGRALRTCADNGVLVVAAAGNDGCECLHVPAAVDGVLAVALFAIALAIVAGVIGLTVTVLALRSRPYRNLSSRYAAAPGQSSGDVTVEATAAYGCRLRESGATAKVPVVQVFRTRAHRRGIAAGMLAERGEAASGGVNAGKLVGRAHHDEQGDKHEVQEGKDGEHDGLLSRSPTAPR